MRNVVKVVLWKIPLTFCALAQGSGCAARDLTMLEEAILFVPQAIYNGTEAPQIPDKIEEAATAEVQQGVDQADANGQVGQEVAIVIDDEGADAVGDIVTRAPAAGH